MKDFNKLINTKEYDFLRTNEHLQNKIILLGLGGSYAYGTNIETSDIDIRGIALNSKSDILGMSNFEQFVEDKTDTTIYSFNKIVKLLLNSNPNTIEMLGLRPQDYLYLSDIGQELLNNKNLFLSKKCIYSFGGYANQQLRRLENKSNREVGQSQNEEHILKTINHAHEDFKQKYFMEYDGNINLYTDKSNQDEYDTEIFFDGNFSHYPLRDYKNMIGEMQNIVKSYSKIGKRNEKAIEHNKLGKHMMHLIRLYMMCIDLLEKEEIITYRKDEHDLLMSIRNGEYLTNDKQPTSDFYELLNEYEKRFEYAKKNTSLKDKPNYKRVEEFVISVNERSL